MPRLHTILISCVAAAASLSAGCSSTCSKVQADYQARLELENPFVESVSGDQTHFGVAMHTDLVNSILSTALVDGLDKALDFTDTIKLASGKSISVRTEGKVLDLKVFTDKSCDTCVRVTGKLDGKLAVKVPILPIQRVPLRGSASLVAPIELARSEDGKGELKLNLSKMAQIGKSTVDAEIGQLPPSWSKVLRSPLSKTITEKLSESLGSVTVARIDALDLGIQGLEVIPTKIATDSSSGVVFVGFTTNLAGLDGAAIQPTTNLSAQENLALSFHPKLMVPMVTAAIRGGKVSRQYIKNGKASDRGPFHVTLESFSIAAQKDKKTPFDMGFRLWHMPDDGQCYWVDAVAQGNLGINATQVAVDVDGVELGESSLPGLVLAIAEWTNADFLEESRRVLNTSLSKKAIDVPGATARVARASLHSEADSITFRAKLAVDPAKKD